MRSLAYRDFVRALSTRFDSELSELAPGQSFDSGPGFPIAICSLLCDLLSDRFGVTRGGVVTASGDRAGDGIVVFERAHFPTLAGRARGDIVRRELVPIEAAYAYIEARHALHLTGDGSQSIAHAVEQVVRVKALVSTRASVPLGPPSPCPAPGSPSRVAGPGSLPGTANPFFAIVFSRQVRYDAAGPILSDPTEVDRRFEGLTVPFDPGPDHVVLGRSNIVLPAIPDPADPERLFVRSPFFLPSASRYSARIVPDVAFGLSLVSLLAALDRIRLGEMPWHGILMNALENVPGVAGEPD